MQVLTLKLGNQDNNAYWLTDESTGACAVVDPGFADEPLRDLVSSRGGDLRYILLTHRHYDHIMAARWVKEQTGAAIAIHPKDACGLSSAAFSLSGVRQQALSPDHTLADNEQIHLGDSVIRVIETPGHTIGSICFLCEEYLITGDTLFRLGMGRTDLPTGNADQMVNSLKKLADLPGDYRVLPGHGKPSTLDVERTMNPFMIEAQKR